MVYKNFALQHIAPVAATADNLDNFSLRAVKGKNCDFLYK